MKTPRIKLNSDQAVDLVVCIVMIVVWVPLILNYQLNFLTSTLLFFGAPSLYLTLRKPKSLKRILFGSVLFGLMFGFFLDFIAEYNHAWSWPEMNGLVFPSKIFDLIPFDVVIWYFLWVFFILTFYEHFIEGKEKDVISHHFRYAFVPSVISIVTVITIYLTKANLLTIPYTYLVLGLVTMPTFIYIIWRRPRIIKKILTANIFYAALFLTFEVVALRLDQWRFPGQYLMKVGLLGVHFPLEEFFYWILISGCVILAFFEHWVDDER